MLWINNNGAKSLRKLSSFSCALINLFQLFIFFKLSALKTSFKPDEIYLLLSLHDIYLFFQRALELSWYIGAPPRNSSWKFSLTLTVDCKSLTIRRCWVDSWDSCFVNLSKSSRLRLQIRNLSETEEICLKFKRDSFECADNLNIARQAQ